jgi:amidase
VTDDESMVRDAFDRYEAALMADDIDTLAMFFWPDATRYGTDGNQYTGAQIDQARRRPHAALTRSLSHTVVRQVGAGAVIAETEFERAGAGGFGRQSQVWVRRAGEWRIVHAHVSMLPGT